ncbi:hypothetical protein LSH36_358g00012 [Paralvinella palmiformis]|uniref:Transmembrane protein 214 n=1 Tax=Paralvinella palmiformis TaxID=53620 RepID=A0AAD9JEM9_9ANNE|nr:hypothetical protein LSH36_358g00012 [Paralvinella palmiformis]
MAATGTHWETVRKPGKKSKIPATNGLSKIQKKQLAENLPRIETAPPVKESPTIYQAFIEKEPPPKTEKPTGNGTTQPKKPSHPPKKKSAEQKSKPTTMTEAIDVGDLHTVLTKVQTTFPENPSVWLKDLASILNLKMDKVPEPDPVFQDKPYDYPLCMLPTPVKKLLRETVNQCSTDTLQHFIEHCIHSMVADMKQDIAIYLCLQYQELMRTNQNRVLRCLSIMWAVGQAGVTNLDTGLKVWLQLMFSTLNIRSLSAYSVEYIEKLFQLHKNLKPALNTLKVKDFFNIMDVFFTPQPSLPSNLQKRLQAVYPKIQTVAFGINPENHLRQFFPQFFSRLTANNKLIQQEAISGLVTCLSVDKGSFSEWRQMYTKNNLLKSGVLLQHICKNWESVSKVVDKKKLQETIGSFNVTNEDMAAKEDMQNVEGFQMCVTACKELLSKMCRSSIPGRWLVFCVIYIFASLLFLDLYMHKGYENSKTYKILSDTGIQFYLEQIVNKFSVYTNKVYSWVQDTFPYYFEKISNAVGPYLQLFWEKTYDAAIYIVEISKPVRLWLNEKIPIVLEWLNEKCPIVWNAVCTYSAIVGAFLLKYLVVVWQYFVHVMNIFGTWLAEDVFVGKLAPENILQTLSELLYQLQTYMISLKNWVVALVTGAKG